MRFTLALSLALVLSGCFQLSSVLTVRPDGSATLRDEIEISGMVRSLMDESDEGAEMFGREAVEERAAALGPGVRIASFEETEEGYVAIYDVPDIRTLRYSSSFDPSGTASGPADQTVDLQFAFEPAEGETPATLRIHMPKPAAEKPAEPRTDDDMDEDGALDVSMLSMMRSFFEDMQLTVAIDIEGEIVETNAPYVDDARVTAVDFRFVELIDFMIENPDLVEAFDDPSDAEMYEIIDQVEGIRILRPGTVHVRFR